MEWREELSKVLYKGFLNYQQFQTSHTVPQRNKAIDLMDFRSADRPLVAGNHLIKPVESFIESLLERVIEDMDKAICKHWQEDGGVNREKVKQQLKSKYLGKESK